MAGSNEKKDKTNSQTIKFTIDSDRTGLTEIPSITRLLNRKKLIKPDGSVEKVPTGGKSFLQGAIEQAQALADQRKLQASRENAPQEKPVLGGSQPLKSQAPSTPASKEAPKLPSLPPAATSGMSTPPSKIVPSPSIAPPASTPATGTPSVRPSKRAPRTEMKGKLLIWDRVLLSSSPDPLAQALFQMVEKGLDQVLFLESFETDDEKKSTAYRASATYSPRSKSSLWNGMVWNPTVTPQLWTQIISIGFAELLPPETTTQVTSERNVARTAFGADGGEYLMLARVGPQHDPRGVIALFSKDSLLSEIQTVLFLLSSAVPKEKTLKTAA